MLVAIKNEIYKMFRNKYLWISAIAMFALMMGELFFSYSVYCDSRKMVEKYNIVNNYPFVLSRYWIGGDLASVYNKLFYYLIPIIAVLPFSITYYTEMRSGYAKNICTRIKKKHYICAKAVVSFVSGGMVCAMALLFNLWTSALYSVDYPQSPILLISPIGNRSLFSEIFYNKPMLYIFIYIGMNFLFGGIFALISMSVVCLCSNIFIYVTFPFLLNISLYYMLLYDSAIKYVPIAFLNPLQMLVDADGKSILISFCVLLVYSIIALHIHVRKDILT